MEAPTPGGSGSMMSTLAPLVMSACAMLSSVASLPCAFWTENSEDDRPAVVRALVRYGASNSVYLAEETVSGRMTPTFPLPLAVIAFSPAIAEKSLVKELALIDGVELEVEPVQLPSMSELFSC